MKIELTSREVKHLHGLLDKDGTPESKAITIALFRRSMLDAEGRTTNNKREERGGNDGKN